MNVDVQTIIEIKTELAALSERVGTMWKVMGGIGILIAGQYVKDIARAIRNGNGKKNGYSYNNDGWTLNGRR